MMVGLQYVCVCVFIYPDPSPKRYAGYHNYMSLYSTSWRGVRVTEYTHIHTYIRTYSMSWFSQADEWFNYELRGCVTNNIQARRA